MLLNRYQKEQFIKDYTLLTYPQLQDKYGASPRKLWEFATAMNLEKKRHGRIIGAKNLNNRDI